MEYSRAMVWAATAYLMALGALACDGELDSRATAPGEQAKRLPPGEEPPGEMLDPKDDLPIVRPPDEPVLPSMMDEICRTVDPGEAPTMRLTEDEYEGAVATIFPALEVDYAARMKEEKVGPFDANVSVPAKRLHAEHYRDNAERVAEAALKQLPEVVPCASSREELLERIEAEELLGTVGQVSGDSWLLWSVGNVSTGVEIAQGGLIEISVRAWGSRAGSDLPEMVVHVDGAEQASFEVDALSASPEIYRFELDLEAGSHEISVSFTNDFNENGEDRNLWVDYIELNAKAVTVIEPACFEEFVTGFGRRAWRKPLSSGELQRFTALYETVGEEQGAGEGLRAVIEGGLQSPRFLYRIEGSPQGQTEAIRKLDGYEMASRLAFFFWDASPDESLMQAAASGELDTVAQVMAQAERMLEDKRARAVLNRALGQMFGLDKLFEYNKEDERYTPEVRQALYDEAIELIDHLLWEQGANLSDLLTTEYAFVSRKTAYFYGVELAEDQGKGGATVRVQLDATRHAGLLTHPAVLARHGYGQMNVHRGLFVRETFFCDRPAPPPDVLENPPETFEGQSDRSRGEGRLEHPGCTNCHQHMDVIGNAFDLFSPTGAARVEDRFGNALRDDAELLHTTSDDQKFNGATALGSIMSQSDQVEACVSSQWLRYALGRYLNETQDACTVHVLEQAAEAADGDIRQMFIAIATTDAFRYVRRSED